MSEATISTSALLDLAASTDDEVVRQRAIDRLSSSKREAGPRAADGMRGASAAVECFLDRLRLGGVPASPRALDPAAVELGRLLLDLDSDSLDRFARDLGTVEAVVLIRSTDRATAAEALRSLSRVRDRLSRFSSFAPELSQDGLVRTVRRFTALSPRGFTGAALERALGRSLLAALVANAEPDVVAAVGLRLPLVPDEEASVDASWFAVASLLARNRADDGE